MEDGRLQSGEHTRLACWFRRLAETIFKRPRTRDGFASTRDGRATRQESASIRVIRLPRRNL